MLLKLAILKLRKNLNKTSFMELMFREAVGVELLL